MLKAGENLDIRLSVSGGKQSDIALTVDRNIARFVARDDNAKYEIKYDLPSSVKAPIKWEIKSGKHTFSKTALSLTKSE